MVDPSPAWTPVKSTCSETQKCLIMLYHLFARTNSRQLLEPSIGIFGTNRCYEDVYAMHLMPLLNVKELWIPTAHKSRQHQHQPQATADTRPIISLNSGTLTNHVIRFARASSDLARMGPIPKNTIPYFDLGTFESWFGDFIRRIETVLGRGNRELRLPSIFLDEGGGTGVAVTNGIKVQVSSAFMLSMARVCYRITLTYLPGQCSFESVQLYSRKWAFRYLNGRIERVQGEGVIGYYPLLSESTPNFSYCSYSDGGRVMDPDSDDEDDEEDALDRDHDPLDPYAEGRSLLRNPVVSCEGSFTFIPGSIENPAGGGRPFEAAIPFVEFVRPQTMCL
ncbi:hypothetical protein BDR26DRAFT_873563 [Obelidium mucronatum]|nr:hypothetical protein BDR26DRAFT_873563 [Obelidium mucronatum]